MIDFQLPGESAAAHKGPSLQGLPGALALRYRPRRNGGASCVLFYHKRRQQSSGLRQGCSSACTLCPSKAAQSVQPPPQLGIIVFVRRKRRAQFDCPSPRTPAARCNRQPRAPSGGAVSFLPSATCPSCAAFLGGEPPLSHLQPTGPSPPRPTPEALISVLRNLDRSALRLTASFEKQTYSSSSGSAAAVLESY